MKKSPFILALSLAAILTLTGCGNNVTSESAVINKLSHEVDRAINSVNIVTETYSRLPVSEVSEKITSSSSPKIAKLASVGQNISHLTSTSSAKRTQLLQKAKNVKNIVAGGLTLGEQNTNALSELTSAMQRYTTALNRTRSDYNNTVRSLSKFSSLDSSEVDAKLTRLNCCLQAREVYINNLLSTLDNIEQIINSVTPPASEKKEGVISNEGVTPELDEGVTPLPDEDNKSIMPNDIEQDVAPEANDKKTEQESEKGIMPEGVTPIPNEGVTPILDEDDEKTEQDDNKGIIPEGIIPSNQSAMPFNNFNGYGYGANGYNGYGANGYNGYGANGYGANGYGVNGYGVNNGYNNYYSHNGFNPNRNTDTYGPIVRNIDTYRGGVTPLLDESNNNTECENCNEGVTPVLDEKIDNKCEDCNEIKQSHNDEIMTLPLKSDVPVLEKKDEGVTPILEKKDKDICEDCKDEGVTPILEKQNIVDECQNCDDNVSPASTEQIEGEDKVKGHTQTAYIFDINQNIEKLIKE